VLIILLLIVFSFAAGMRRLPRWTLLIAPAGCLAFGAELVDSAPPEDDMAGIGYGVGIFLAVVCVLVWIVGRAAIDRADRVGRPTSRPPA
jgi:hypothetical protein